MLATERHRLILDLLAHQKSVTVLEFVETLKSSQATIRRDLQYLEEKRKLKRVHGGAECLTPSSEESLLTDKLAWYTKEKQAIGKYVATHFLSQVKRIYLDAGSTTHNIIPFLSATKHEVITNGVHHVSALLEYGIPTLLVGGQLKQTTQAIIGSVALQQLQQYQFDMAILGTNGIDFSFGFSTPDSEEAMIKQLVKNHANQTIIVSDSSKFDKKSFHQFATFEDTLLVVDSCPKKYQRYHNIYTVKEG
ncbi:DeoR family transcriptional regulator [Granulicatella sp. zg-ZJ]|uniref:DeoR/GlpR family DNA-binding transcription regulator n=1 Tax=Granulicatella sp. zg-ZJ TaxID=2678504 RepID=UPI0013D45BF9|nr:DeoR/GlpR family DNA-binding transcription regulator [Granulicatella sp. zg-ZJ]NEW62608.1 DeoR family transcriptional regulator [Granulicatella sp. zg-ZJ]